MTIEQITDMIENVLLNVKKPISFVETTKKIHEKIATMEVIIEQKIVKIIVLLNVQQIFQRNLNVEIE
nr:hypothetical protein [bacterium]